MSRNEYNAVFTRVRISQRVVNALALYMIQQALARAERNLTRYKRTKRAVVNAEDVIDTYHVAETID